MVKSVNNEVKALAQKLNLQLKESAVYLEYQKYHQLIKDNKELFEEEEALKLLQQEIVNATYHQKENVEALKAEYEDRMKQYQQHPLVANYLVAKNALNDDLQYINQYINSGIK